MATKQVKVANLSEGAWAGLNAIRQATEPVTLAEINDLTQVKVSSAHMTALLKRELIEAVKTVFVCECCGSKSTKNVYTIVQKGLDYAE